MCELNYKTTIDTSLKGCYRVVISNYLSEKKCELNVLAQLHPTF